MRHFLKIKGCSRRLPGSAINVTFDNRIQFNQYKIYYKQTRTKDGGNLLILFPIKIFYVSPRGCLIIKSATCRKHQVVGASGSRSTLLSFFVELSQIFFGLSIVREPGSTDMPEGHY